MGLIDALSSFTVNHANIFIVTQNHSVQDLRIEGNGVLSNCISLFSNHFFVTEFVSPNERIQHIGLMTGMNVNVFSTCYCLTTLFFDLFIFYIFNINLNINFNVH